MLPGLDLARGMPAVPGPRLLVAGRVGLLRDPERGIRDVVREFNYVVSAVLNAALPPSRHLFPDRPASGVGEVLANLIRSYHLVELSLMPGGVEGWDG